MELPEMGKEIRATPSLGAKIQDEEQLRPLTNDEAELLRWMFDHGSDDPRTFRSQLENIQAARCCSCGCPSIHLEVAKDVQPGADRGEKVVGDFAGKTAQGELVGILLFQEKGKLTELEVYSMDGLAEGAFGLPDLGSMSVLEWVPSPTNPGFKVPFKSPGSPA